MPRTIVITGASSGVGLAAAEQLAAAGHEVALVGRTPERLAAAARRVRDAQTFRADFEDLDQVRDLAARLREAYPKIDVLANNAGGMVEHYRRTKDGFEATIQGNHLASFLLTHLLRDRLSGGTVIGTASRAHMRGAPDPADLVGDPARWSSFPAYGAAKAANILFAAEAARRWPEITSVSFHPGVVRTNFGAGKVTRFFYKYAPFLVTPEKAGALLTWLATNDHLVDGAYYVGHEVKTPARHAADPALAARLWDASAEATGVRE
ncbi:SDR family NAD(P)-dependent oxidoreductase [Paractinoplanes lichenicola]|uniref:SDR family NAD(P)-dependent oxidoreductase n=1 Tax=Paractinoplanes lichenicola TaxID=2802976 RepID=A0ABS1VPJ6_9ACTN|nr:SDR family NAD(P)-dependent oxidoreductase [Actinoplanes lichenicola]MBL7256549.1 SDR family NAD(P)-dependent oxidoreductase [Actinoplanes lichenicola]